MLVYLAILWDGIGEQGLLLLALLLLEDKHLVLKLLALKQALAFVLKTLLLNSLTLNQISGGTDKQIGEYGIHTALISGRLELSLAACSIEDMVRRGEH